MAVDYGGVRKEFDYQRKRAQQSENANVQQQRDALQRRSAQLGGGPSGAMIKQEQVVSDQSARRLGDVNEGIASAERGEMRRVREIDDGRQFQTAERLGSQKFASGESAMARAHQQGQFDKTFGLQSSQFDFTKQAYQTDRGDRLDQQGWQRKVYGQDRADRLDQQDWTRRVYDKDRSDRLDQQDWQRRAYDKTYAAQQKQFDESVRQFGISFDWQKQVDQFNMAMADRMMNEKDPIEKLFSKYGGGLDQAAFGTGLDVVTGGGYSAGSSQGWW